MEIDFRTDWMSSEKVGVWRRGGHGGGRGRGFPERNRGEKENRDRGFIREGMEKTRERGFYGNEEERKNRGSTCEVQKRGKIVWGTEPDSERGRNNGGKMQEIKNSEMVGRCTEFCPMEEKRMRTKERLLHR